MSPKSVFDVYGNSQEVRAVERRTLLETLAKQLPVDSICFSSKLARIEEHKYGETLLELVNDYPDGQPFGQRVNYIYGQGIRAGYVPVSPTKVYWFVCFNSPSPGPKITDPIVLKKQTKELIKKWPSELQNIVDATPDDTIIWTPLVDRWLWPGFSPPASLGGAVLVGDAWHPMTPNLGQGACCALEDAVVLVQKLAPALKAGPMAIEDALRSYQTERWPQIFPMTVRANVVGAVLQLENPVVCAVRDNVLVPKLIRLGLMLEHTNFEFEPLPQTRV
ncbi:hypothetical protein L1987_08372 [Smallanthus sonchifolius]|uniref:Uncharacterized protein n=1 Tax=Smallanthus sonchifolius TaxID=185202 RepID=A0ACB9JJZ6_9ASTR|nr:hypothetical protein L1987_08372 [Smallanthus sonchifolius]